MSNAFVVTTPYVNGAGVGYFETHGALEFSPHSAVDPTAPTNHYPLQHRRGTSDALPQWKGVPRIPRSSTTDIAPHGNSFSRPGIQASKTATHPDNQTAELDYDEMIGIRDDSDAEARMRRLLNQLALIPQPDARAIHEEDWASSSSSSLGQGVPPYGPSTLTRAAFARQRGESKETRDPVPLRGADPVSPQDDDIIGYYTETESGLPVSGQSQFPNSTQNITTRPPLHRYKSAPSTPNTTGIVPQPSRSLRQVATADERYSHANYAPSRKPSLVRGRFGGSEQNLRDLPRQNSRSAPPGYGIRRSNSGRAPFMNPPATPASPSPALPGLIPDSISRSSSFASIQTRLATPTDSTTPVLSGAPHPLGRIDEKASLDYNEIEAAKRRQTIFSQTSSHVSSEAKERGRMMEERPGLRSAAPLPSTDWRTPSFADDSSGKYFRPATATSSGGTGSELSLGSGPRALSRLAVPKGGVHHANFRSGASEFSSFTDSLSSGEGKTNSMQEKITPSVFAATAFAMTGTMPIGVSQSKAEKAAEKARQKAEKAAQKAEAAALKVELEREAKAQQEEIKRVAAENKRQAVEARKREKDERQRKAELAMTKMLFGT